MSAPQSDARQEVDLVRGAHRARRDLAVAALYSAGLSSIEISKLRVDDVRVFASGRASVRLAPDFGITRGVRPRPRFVLIDGLAAARLADYVACRAAAPLGAPLFPGRRGRFLSSRGILLLLHRSVSAIEEAV